jgi:homoserine O-acetyltransferase/O-succinyltransferase
VSARAGGRLLALLGLTLGCSQQHASLGDFTLQSGQVIRDCQLGYRTFGQLNATGSNAVLVTLWSMGRSSQVGRQIGPGKLVDPTRHFVIAVDPLGNGVSSSPSTSDHQPGEAFPTFTIADMVEAQHQLLTRVLKIHHLKAVVGTSLGGMQAFQWATAHPEFMDQVVTISGSPHATAAEQARWKLWSEDVQRPRWKRAAHELGKLSARGVFSQLRLDRHDYARQAQAIIAHDVSRPFGSMEQAARVVRARMLVVVSPTDDVVDPATSRAFAALVRAPGSARMLELDGRCGHGAPSCEKEALWQAVGQFLE